VATPAPPPDESPPPEDLSVKSESVPFVVGKVKKNDRRLLVLDERTPPPFEGPFELRAVFSK
jgi:hypothetical protein